MLAPLSRPDRGLRERRLNAIQVIESVVRGVLPRHEVRHPLPRRDRS